MKRAATCLAMAILFLVPAAVWAQSPNYSFAEIGPWRVEPDGASSENGFFVGGSAGISKFQVVAAFGDAGDFDQWFVGGGWHGLLGQRADLVAEGQFIHNQIGGDGLGVSLGIRWMVLRRLELNGFANYTRLDYVDTSGELNGIWDFARRFGVGAGYEYGSDLKTLRAFVRLNFGKRE